MRHDRRHDRRGPPPRPGRKRGTQSQAIGKSKGGWTTKILALTDALGNLVRFVLLPGQRYDTMGVAPLIQGIEFDAFAGLQVDLASNLLSPVPIPTTEWPNPLQPPVAFAETETD